MTAGIRDAIEKMTGYRADTCPWRAFYDPFVRRVLDAMVFFESGQLAFANPDPSHKLVEAVGFYERVNSGMRAKQMELDREQAQKDHDRMVSEMRSGRGR